MIKSSRSFRVADCKGATWKLLLHSLFSHSWAPPKEAAEGADGRAECAENEGSARARTVTASENPRRQRRA